MNTIHNVTLYMSAVIWPFLWIPLRVQYTYRYIAIIIKYVYYLCYTCCTCCTCGDTPYNLPRGTLLYGHVDVQQQ